MLFQRGKCRAAAKCHQIHAEREYITQLRSQAKESNCCIAHGDPRAKEDGFLEQLKASKTFVLASNDEAHVLSVDSLARTSELVKLFEQKVGDTMTIPIRKICRLHQKQQCLFGKDCKNIHLCRDVWRSVQRSSTPTPPTTRTPPRSPVQTAPSTRTPVKATGTPPRSPVQPPPVQTTRSSTPTPTGTPPRSPVQVTLQFESAFVTTPESSSPESSPGPSSRSPSPPLLNADAFIPEVECAISCASFSQHLECCDVLTPNSFGRAQQALRSFIFAWNPPCVL
jgi:hypothetical protein